MIASSFATLQNLMQEIAGDDDGIDAAAAQLLMQVSAGRPAARNRDAPKWNPRLFYGVGLTGYT